MSSEIAIKVENLNKCYQIYDRPRDRLKQFILPCLQGMAGLSPKQYYREFWALKNVSFEVKKGETVGIIGRNGSGKSTLLQMICGTLNPTSGKIQTNGRIAALLELGSGFNPDFTGRENVYLNGALLGLSKSEIDERFCTIESFADIGDFIDQPVKTYSSGMFVRLAFSIQANVDPEILIVDEALAVGDAYFVHKCMDRLYQLQESGTSILLVTHDGTTIKRFCSRAYWLNDGIVQAQGEASTVVDAYITHLFQIPLVEEAVDEKTSSISNKKVLPSVEMYIPNIDRRLGDQRAKIVGVGLYNSAMHLIDTIENNSEIVLRYTVRNLSIEKEKALCFGYSIKNSRGDDIASSNTQIEGLQVEGFLNMEQLITVSARIKIPFIYPGSYAFSIGVSHLEGTEPVISDRIINAILIQITSTKKMHSTLSFDTDFEIERECRVELCV
jgi:lipopolysaccharide transport system ATP-binding protein